MYIPSSTSDFSSVVEDISLRSLTSNVVSTADSFKNWDTCMDNHTCKIVAIVLICVAAFIAMWFVMAVVSCCCMGMKIMEGCCFCFTCCCRGGSRNQTYQQPQYVEKQQTVYDNPNMYGPTRAPQMYNNPPTPAHFANQHQGAYDGYQPVNNDVYEPNSNIHVSPFTDTSYNDNKYRY